MRFWCVVPDADELSSAFAGSKGPASSIEVREVAKGEEVIALSELPKPKLPKHTRIFLICFYALAVAWGVRNVNYWEPPSNRDLPFQIAFAICLSWWAIADARIRGKPLPMLSRPFFVLFSAIVVPVYTITSRGWRGLGWVALNSVLWLTMYIVTTMGIGVAVYGQAWLNNLN